MTLKAFVPSIAFFLLCLCLPCQAWAAFEGFSAAKKAASTINATGYAQVKGFQTDLKAHGGFLASSNFDEVNGVYTAPETGYYHFNAVVRLDNAEFGTNVKYTRAFFAINTTGVRTQLDAAINNGSHVIQGNVSNAALVLTTQAAFYLTKGDKVTLWVFSSHDTQYVVQIETSFAGAFLGKTRKSWFHADLVSDIAVKTTNWTKVGGWRTSGAKGLVNTGGHFNATTGEYTVPQDGYYYFSARLRLDNAGAGSNKRYSSLLFAVNGVKDATKGLSSISRPDKGSYDSVVLTATVNLKKGDKVTLWVSHSDDNSYTVQGESGFSGYLIESMSSAVFRGSVGGATAVTWTATADSNFHVVNNITNTGSAGRFDPNKYWDASSSTYTAPYRGYYRVNGYADVDLNVSLPYARYYRVYASINGVARYRNGLSGLQVGVSHYRFGLQFETLLFLEKGDKLQLVVENHISGLTRGLYTSAQIRAIFGNPSYQVMPSSHFSIVLLGYTDLDKDGADSSIDCDDDNDKVYPAFGGKKAPIEICDKIDNDCNNKVDDIGGTCTLSSAIGACKAGTFACDAAGKKICKTAYLSRIESCTGKDDNCDGKVDNIPGAGQPCEDTTRVGACRTGVWKCVQNKKTCEQTTMSATEVCDGQDTDCNGRIDDVAGLGTSCQDTNRKGKCQQGIWGCLNDKKTCLASHRPTPEVCDGQDSDCDGTVDNIPELGKTCQHPTKKGECVAGTWACLNNQKTCVPIIVAKEETCNGKDDNCDGIVDNIIDRGQPCKDKTQKGPCTNGKWACINNQKKCEPLQAPFPETCDGLDNDCNGKVDDGIDCTGKNTNTDPCASVTCKTGEVCTNGTCAPHPCTAVTCPKGEYCRNGTCAKLCSCPVCPLGESCIDGSCQPDPCGGVRCPTGEACDSATGQCTADPCLGKTCGKGQICVNGSCIQDPCLLSVCGANEVCSNGQCYEPACAPTPPVQPSETTVTEGIASDAGPQTDAPANVGCSSIPFSSFFWLAALALLGLPMRRKR